MEVYQDAGSTPATSIMPFQTNAPDWAFEAGGLGFIKLHPDEPAFPAESHPFSDNSEQGYHYELIGLDCDETIKFYEVFLWWSEPISKPGD